MRTDAWHYVRGEQQFGPVPFQVLQSLARTGDLSAEDLIWSEGMPDWVTAGSMQGLFTSQRTPRVKSGGVRSSGGHRSRGPSVSRRPGRAFSRGAGLPGSGPATHDRAERRTARQTSTMPGGIIAAVICDLLVSGLTALLGFMSLSDAARSRHLAREQIDQNLTNLHWHNADASQSAAIVVFIIAGVFAAVAIVLLTRQSWGPVAQTALSLLASLPFLVVLGETSKPPQVVGANQVAHLLLILALVFLVAPICCVWSRSSKDWVSGRASGRSAAGRRRRRGT